MHNGKPIDWETRLSKLEADVQAIKAMLQAGQQAKQPWWKAVVGSFADNPAFEEASRLGREMREKEREKLQREREKELEKLQREREKEQRKLRKHDHDDDDRDRRDNRGRTLLGYVSAGKDDHRGDRP